MASALAKRTAVRLGAQDTEQARLAAQIDLRIARAQHELGLNSALAGEVVRTWTPEFEKSPGSFDFARLLTDLEAELGLRETRGGSWRAGVDWLVSHVPAVLTIATLLFSAVLGVAYARFYRELNLTPEQVGLSATEIVAQSILGSLLMITVWTVIFAGTYLSWRAIFVRSEITPRIQSSDLVALGKATFAAVIVGFLGVVVGIPWWAVAGALIPPFIVGTLRVLTRRSPAVYLSRFNILLAVGAVAPGIVLLFGSVIYSDAKQKADDVRDGKAVTESTFIGFPILDIRATRATSETVGQASPQPGEDPCLIYLGSANGLAVFFNDEAPPPPSDSTEQTAVSSGASADVTAADDPTAEGTEGQTVQRPISTLKVEIPQDQGTCPEPSETSD